MLDDPMADKPVQTLKDLSIEFPTPQGVVQAVKALSLDIHKGRRVGFFGERGSGKTTTALAVMQMLAEPGRIAGGNIDLGGTMFWPWTKNRCANPACRASRTSRRAR